MNAPKDGMPAVSTYSIEAVRALDTHRTLIQKQPEMLLCLVGISRRYYLGDEVYLTFLHDDDRDMDLFNLICAPNPTKVKTRSRPRAPHEVPLLTLTATRVIEMDDPAAATDSSGVPSTIEKSPLDFADEAGVSDQGTVAPEMPPSEDVPATDAPGADQAKEVVATDPPAATESHKRGRDGTDGNAPPKSLLRDHADPRPTGTSRVSDPDPLSFTDPPSRHPTDIPQSSQGTGVAGDLDYENASSPVEVGSPESIYRPEQYNVNLARQVAMGSQLRLRFEQEAKLLRKFVAQVARRDKRIQAQELEIKNLEALLETEADMKKAAEDRSAGLIQELEDMRAWFSDLQVSNERLSQQVATLQEQDARLDALSIDFDEELYPHMLTAIAGRMWVIGHGLRLAVMKCGESLEMRQAFADVVFAGIAKGMSEGLRHGVEHGQARLNVESIEAYDPEAKAKFIAALEALKDLKYLLVDQLEGLKDAPMDVIMAALYLESDTRGDASQYIRDLRPSSSQLTIPVYPEAGSDGVPVSVPTVVPQGLALLLADAATHTEFDT
nr:transposase (putative), gypsy type [Tanacetum cinerariifolium]